MLSGSEASLATNGRNGEIRCFAPAQHDMTWSLLCWRWYRYLAAVPVGKLLVGMGDA